MDIKLEKKRGIKKKHIPYVVIGVIFMVIVGLILSSTGTKKLSINAKSINIATVEEGEFNEYIRISGSAQPKVIVQLTPFEGGIVSELLVEEGATLKRGDVILKLTNTQLNLDILNTEASLAEKENFLRDTRVRMEQEVLSLKQNMVQYVYDMKRAERKNKQYKRLVEQQLVSEEDYLQSQEDYDLASSNQKLVAERQANDSIYRSIQITNLENSLSNMTRNMKLTYERLDNLNVKSPIDGQLGSLDAVLGQSLGSGMNIGQVNDLSSYKIQMLIDEHYIDRVTKGLRGSFERGGETFVVVVSKVYPGVTDGKFKSDLVFESASPDNIRSGQTYYINLQTGDPDNSIYIPRGSFFQSSGGNWIFVVSEDGSRALKRPIRIGKQNPLYYEVVEGLAKGERVVTSSYEMFGDSDELIIKE